MSMNRSTINNHLLRHIVAFHNKGKTLEETLRGVATVETFDSRTPYLRNQSVYHGKIRIIFEYRTAQSTVNYIVDLSEKPNLRTCLDIIQNLPDKAAEYLLRKLTLV